MTARDIARAQAAGRVLVGAALAVAPRSGAGWIGPVSGERPTTVFTRALGARDAVMGLGVLRFAGDTEALRPWVAAGIVADAVDFLASLEARDELPQLGRAVAPVVAGGSVLLGAWVLAALR